MKKKARKLVIHRETIHLLNNTVLPNVVGGSGQPGCAPPAEEVVRVPTACFYGSCSCTTTP